jgi:hypothetical protein
VGEDASPPNRGGRLRGDRSRPRRVRRIAGDEKADPPNGPPALALGYPISWPGMARPWPGAAESDGRRAAGCRRGVTRLS